MCVKTYIQRILIVCLGINDFLFRLFQQYPCAILPMANQIIKRLSPTIRKMDFGLEWAMAEGGKALFVYESSN